MVVIRALLALVAALWFMPSIAFAQALVAAAPNPAFQTSLGPYIADIVQILTPVLLALLAAVFWAAYGWLSQKWTFLKNDQVKSVTQPLADYALQRAIAYGAQLARNKGADLKFSTNDPFLAEAAKWMVKEWPELKINAQSALESMVARNPDNEHAQKADSIGSHLTKPPAVPAPPPVVVAATKAVADVLNTVR